MYVVGQIVKMKKGHPCGGNAWRIIRVGMDFRIKCLKCGHSVMLTRHYFERKVVKETLPPDTGTPEGG